ncbi:DMT family transporter [Candidatus Saccharibacteria bacterium]|nr:DMT family transporter [Candidatus Saccharibacteria bacterium]
MLGRLKKSPWAKILLLGSIFANLFLSVLTFSVPVAAVPGDDSSAGTSETAETSNTSSDTTQTSPDSGADGTSDTSASSSNSSDSNSDTNSTKDACRDEAGGLGWVVCPSTGFLAKITDGLYEVIEEFLVVKPLSLDSDSAFYQAWSIFRDLTNIVFIIFFLIVIYSQLTGIGISNYGIKKALPKVVIAAIMINLSYILCALLVDLSNIIGASIRGIFLNLETSIAPTGILASSETGDMDFTALVAVLTGTVAITGFTIAATGGLGALFLTLIPVLLGAVAAIVIAYITVATRQALIYLLIMISPLAFVCMFLPNTEKWFNTWKQTLSKMLIFYPLFGALFGACSLIGWVIIAGAETPLLLILGMAVKIIPLFMSWNLLKMSGTIPGQVNNMLRSLSKAPLGAANKFFASEAALSRARYLGGVARPYQSNRRLAQYLEDRRNRREIDTRRYLEGSKLRGAGFAAELTNSEGNYTRRAEDLFALENQNGDNRRKIARTENDFNEGLDTSRSRSYAQFRRLNALNHNAAHTYDRLDMEASRSEIIKYNNSQSRLDRYQKAVEAHEQSALYNRAVNPIDLDRYNDMLDTLNGDSANVHFIAANAANSASVQQKIMASRFKTYTDTLPPTQRVQDFLKDVNNAKNTNANVEALLAGMRTLNDRGDTDLVRDALIDAFDDGQVELGTHASQSFANFLMFEAKDKDFTLRRFGKYLNLETARVFNENQSIPARRNHSVDFKEYLTGRYVDYVDDDGTVHYGKSKLDIVSLLAGTPIDKAERTAFAVLDSSLKWAYGDDIEGFKTRRHEIQKVMTSALIGGGLKYESGSEQIVNLASWLTGLKAGKDDSGKTIWKKRWESEGDDLYGLDEQFFIDRVKDFLVAQTPSQLFSLRTDLFNPFKELLADDYENYARASGDQSILPGDYDSLTPEEKVALRNAGAKNRFQDLLDRSGKLQQIYSTRKSGAANNAKDALRDFLDLGDEDKIIAYLNAKKKEQRAKNAPSSDDDSSPSGDGVYTETDRLNFQNEFTRLLLDDPESPSFYDNALEKLEDLLGRDSMIQNLFEDYHDENPDAGNPDLLSTLLDLLADPDNY